jgi:cytoskeletal protein CcmA (bactofilin family)
MKAMDERRAGQNGRERAVAGSAGRIMLLVLVVAALLVSASAGAWAAPAAQVEKAVEKAVRGAVERAGASADSTARVVVAVGNGRQIDVSQQGCYVVPEGEVVDNDLYIWAKCIDIKGMLDGDIIAGFSNGEISGTVTEDLNGASNSMIVSGEVGDDVRFACETFYLTGHVGDDLLVAGRDVEIQETGSVGGDAWLACGTATINGHVGGNARIATGALEINGTIDGDADIYTDGGIRFGPNGHIGGNLMYEGPSRLELPEGTVGGTVTFHEKPEKEKSRFSFPAGLGIFFHVLSFIMALVAGSVIVALTKKHALHTAEVIRTKPLKSLGIGFVTFIVMPLVLLILLVLIVTAPLMFVLTMAYLIALYIAKFYVAIWLGNVILGHKGRSGKSAVPPMLLGLLIIYLVTAIPILGTFIGVVIIFFGLGALLQRRETGLDRAFEPAPATPNNNGLPSAFPGDRTGE